MNKKEIWRRIMVIKTLSVLMILSVFAASNVMAGDFKRGHNYDNKRQHSHVVVKNKHTNKRVVTTHYYGKHHTKKVVSKRVVSKKPVQHKKNHNRNDRLGLLVGGIVVGSILSGR